MLIRPALPDDIPAIAAIYGEAVRTGTASFELEAPDDAEMRRRFAAITGAGYPYLAAVDPAGGPLLGYAYASAFRPRIAYRFTVENSVYVAPAAQGRGVGRALMVALIAACETAGFRQMVAIIGGSDNLGSIALHRALGFADIGVMPATGFKFGRWLDTVVMQRALGPGAGTLPPEVPGALR
ncbi:GNAT family N-acetyltransferase [Aquabacter spiritensis]|uniref:Phosphinothricin acetyltransferase n=1 Tax=Aquabacter spiritensis TaxID=933073 RepID=A0A4R3M9H7_9HYPH|nr:GNAT family N-acetyltransferase [Aquabacter spiritensis]TCT08035.1 phosphinothricin acetyltransferase [Aquabacter spiritensis]